MRSPNSRDVAIIGRGIAGLTAAYHLVKAGFSPTLYGSRDNGLQASRAAQGVLCNKGLFFYESPLFQAKIESLASMQRFLNQLERDAGCPLPRFFTGISEPFWNEMDFQATVARVYRHRFWGAHGTEIIADKISESAEAQPLGWLSYPRDGWFDPVPVLDALEAFLHVNHAVFKDKKVQSLALANDGKVFIQTDECSEGNAFDQIILAAGAGTGTLWNSLGLKEPKMFLIGGQTLRYQRQGGHETRIAVKGNQSLALLPDQAILGSTSWPGFDPNSLEADAAELIARTQASFGLSFTGAYASRSGVRLRFKDRMPLVGFLNTGPLAQKVYVLTGFYKNGMHLAETCAQEMLLDLTDRGAERRFKGFSPARFGF